MRINMGDNQHLTIEFHPGCSTVVIIDKEKDIRICDGSHILKIRLKDKKIRDILIDDVFIIQEGDEMYSRLLK